MFCLIGSNPAFCDLEGRRIKPVHPVLSSLTAAAEGKMPFSGGRNTFSPIPSVKQGMAGYEEELGSLPELATAWHCQSVSSPTCTERFLVPNICPQQALAAFHVHSPSRAGCTHILPFMSDFKPNEHPST